MAWERAVGNHYDRHDNSNEKWEEAFFDLIISIWKTMKWLIQQATIKLWLLLSGFWLLLYYYGCSSLLWPLPSSATETVRLEWPRLVAATSHPSSCQQATATSQKDNKKQNNAYELTWHWFCWMKFARIKYWNLYVRIARQYTIHIPTST